jgi:hypothetical protein
MPGSFFMSSRTNRQRAYSVYSFCGSIENTGTKLSPQSTDSLAMDWPGAMDWPEPVVESVRDSSGAAAAGRC